MLAVLHAFVCVCLRMCVHVHACILFRSFTISNIKYALLLTSPDQGADFLHTHAHPNLMIVQLDLDGGMRGARPVWSAWLCPRI